MAGRPIESDVLGAWPGGRVVTSGERADREAMAEDISDRQLIAALRAGDERAAVELFQRVQQPVARTLARILRERRELLEDLTQAAFERMIWFLSARSLDERSNLRAWARTVATNVAIDYLRRELLERRLFVANEHELPATSSPEHALESRAALRTLQAAIASMDPKYAETVLLHDVLGHELSEIAASMGVSVAAAQSRLVRGRKELLKRSARRQP